MTAPQGSARTSHGTARRTLVKRIKSEGDKGIRSYYCDECEHWHVGHIPQAVRRGEYTAGEIYGRPAS